MRPSRHPSTSARARTVPASASAAPSTSSISRRAAKSTGRRLSGSTSEKSQLSCPWYTSGTPGAARRTSVCASEFTIPSSASVRWKGRKSAMKSLPGRSASATKSARPRSYSASGLIQLVWTLASRVAFSM